MTSERSSQSGFAAITAIFLLVVLAALGAFMVSISTSQQLTSAQDLQGSRAYWAAQAGLEWAFASIAVAPTVCPTAPSPFTVDGFALAVTCTSASFNEAATAVLIFSVTSKASAGGSPGGLAYVERSLSASVEK